jgi:hypothetical protein
MAYGRTAFISMRFRHYQSTPGLPLTGSRGGLQAVVYVLSSMNASS